MKAGVYATAQMVTISDSTTGATIYYTADGTTPTVSSTQYTTAITVSSTETLKAIATASGYSTSAVATAAYTIAPPAATPTFSVPAGTYTSPQTVTIGDATTGATIYYTTDGTTPTASSAVYSSPIIVSSSETVEAIATASGYSASTVATATYAINLPAPDFTVAINPASLSVKAGQDGTTKITVQNEGGFNSNISFACSGLPAGDACSFSALTAPTPAGVTYSTLTVSTVATTAALRRDGRTLFPGSVLAVAFCFLGWKKRRRWRMLVLLAVSAVGLSVLSACGGGSNSGGSGGGGTQPVTTIVTVTATSGALSHTTTFSLTVN